MEKLSPGALNLCQKGQGSNQLIVEASHLSDFIHKIKVL